MIDQFGRVMIYVNDPRKVADFWIEKIGFVEGEVGYMESKLISVEISNKQDSEVKIVLFEKAFVQKFSPEINLGSPSILFSTYNLEEMRSKLVEKNVSAGEIIEMMGMRSFNFPDPEGNYFAVREIIKN